MTPKGHYEFNWPLTQSVGNGVWHNELQRSTFSEFPIIHLGPTSLFNTSLWMWRRSAVQRKWAQTIQWTPHWSKSHLITSFNLAHFLWCKMPMFWRAGMREGGKPLPLAFQYLIFMVERTCDLNLVVISSLATKCQHFKLRGLQFHYIKYL